MDATFSSEERIAGSVPPLSTPLLAFLVLWPIALIGGVGYVMNQKWQALTEEQSLRPRIAVIDIDAIVKANKSGRDDEASLQKGLDKANETVVSLRDAGFLVIDRHYVRTAPDAVLVPVR